MLSHANRDQEPELGISKEQKRNRGTALRLEARKHSLLFRWGKTLYCADPCGPGKTVWKGSTEQLEGT